MDTTALERAIEHFETQAKLAHALGVEPMTVSHWKTRGVPPKRAIQIEEVTGGEVTREQLLPELFSVQRQQHFA